jgi:(2R)-ethylmalonyl-CoA mutase
LLVGKPGLDGHSNGAEQIAVCAKDCGMVVVYDGIRMTPEEIVDSASDNNVHVIGLSILSGSHINIVQDVMGLLRSKNMGHIPVVVGGIIPENDINALTNCGVKAVYTPKDFRLTHIMQDIISLSVEHKAS